MYIKDTIKKWDYVQYNIITRIPNAVGRSWEEGYNIRLEKRNVVKHLQILMVVIWVMVVVLLNC